jgi:putative salt-induced outer membrane protein YdiY
MILIPLVLGSGLAAVALVDAQGPIPGPSTVAPSNAAPIQDPPAKDSDGWDGSFNFGASKTDGSTDVENYSLTLDAVKEIDIHRFNVFAGWYYTSTEDVRSQRRAIGSVKYDQFFAEKTYFWVNAFAETNEQALVDLRWSIGGGLGHQFRDDDEMKLSAEAGLAYFNEEFDDNTESDYLAARIAWKAQYTLSETATLNHTGELFPSLEDKEDVYGRADTSVDLKVNARMNARAQWILTWDNTPAAGQERTENLYLLSVGWTF